MPAVDIATDAKLAEFESRHSRFGLIRRYARARWQQLPARLLMAAVGVALVGILISYALAGVTLILVAVGESIDLFMLAKTRRHAADTREVGMWVFVTSASAALHALSVTACFALTYATRPDPAVAFFVIALLFGMAIGDLMLIAYHRIATLARLAIYSVTLAVFFLYQYFGLTHRGDDLWFELVGVVVLAYVLWSCARGLERTTLSGFDTRRRLLIRQQEIEQTAIDLKAAQAENRQLALVARHANDSVVVAQVDGSIVWVNTAFTTMTGYRFDEVIGRPVGDVLNGPETSRHTIDRIKRAIEASEPCRTEILNYTKSGEKIWVDTNIVPVLEDDGTSEIVIAIERDVTTVRRQVDALAQATQDARARADDRSAFVASMRQEIRTPVTGILGMVSALSRAQLPPDQQEQIDTLHASADALLQVLDDVLDVARPGQGQVPIEDKVFSVSACIKSAVLLMRPLALEKGLTLDLSFNGAASASVKGDPGRLRQILLNLVGNAIKFTEAGGVSVAVAARKTAARLDLEVDVRDTGRGVDPSRADAIFNAHEHMGGGSDGGARSTGRGLSISRGLARRMGGDVTYKASEGLGSVFTLALSLPRPSDALSSDATDTDLPETTSDRSVVVPTGVRIVVAGAAETERRTLQEIFRAVGAIVAFVADGYQAVEQTVAQRPDVVLLDLQLPQLNGIEVAKNLRAMHIPQPRIIGMAVETSPNDRAYGLAAGMDAVLLKPVNRQELVSELSDIDPSQKPLGPDDMIRVSG